MRYAFIASDFFPDPNEEIMDSMLKQYERVVVESLVSSFGLDFILKDRYGGDVDTVHNVRKIGADTEMLYKNQANQRAYQERGLYDSGIYHRDGRYIEKNHEIKRQKDAGSLMDAYTGGKIAKNGRSDLDHVISAKEIHEDAGRVLAGLRGVDLANRDENLRATNPRTNRTKRANSMTKFLGKYGDEYTEAQKENMRQQDAKARAAYESKLMREYYTSPTFAKDVAFAASHVGVRMGLRQVLGFVFVEVWFAVKDEFSNIRDGFDLGTFLVTIGNGIKRGFGRAKEKYRDLLARCKEGAIAGALSSLTTTLCNIFFTTAKHVVRLIRQTYVSLVQASKVLFINPDNLPFGERMRAIVKILATGASVVVGSAVSEAVGKTPLGMLPVVGDIVRSFCGTLATGILCCTLLVFFDRSELMNQLVRVLNQLHTFSLESNYFRQQADYFERYAAELMRIDIHKFHEEAKMYDSFSVQIESAKTDAEINTMLTKMTAAIGIKIPWEGDFDRFMHDKNAVLVFK